MKGDYALYNTMRQVYMERRDGFHLLPFPLFLA